MFKAIILFFIIGVCIIVGVKKQLCGSCAQPIEILVQYSEKIVLNKDRVVEYSHLVKDVKDSKEAEVSTRNDLCLSIFNQSDFTLVKLVVRLTNKRTQATETFNLFPVTGTYSGRTNPRVFYAEPHGVNLWTGYFGAFLRDDDEVSFAILSARGFK